MHTTVYHYHMITQQNRVIQEIVSKNSSAELQKYFAFLKDQVRKNYINGFDYQRFLSLILVTCFKYKVKLLEVWSAEVEEAVKENLLHPKAYDEMLAFVLRCKSPEPSPSPLNKEDKFPDQCLHIKRTGSVIDPSPAFAYMLFPPLTRLTEAKITANLEKELQKTDATEAQKAAFFLTPDVN